MRSVADDPAVTQLVPRVEVVAADGTEVAAMRATVSLHDPGARHQLAPAPSLSSVQDAHLLGLRLDRPQQRSARAVYAAFLRMDERDLRGTEDGGAWRWYPSDRTVRWAPVEGAPWARRWKATSSRWEAPDAVVGRRFRALLDPTRPLVGLLALGYTPFHVSKDHLSLHHPTPR